MSACRIATVKVLQPCAQATEDIDFEVTLDIAEPLAEDVVFRAVFMADGSDPASDIELECVDVGNGPGLARGLMRFVMEAPPPRLRDLQIGGVFEVAGLCLSASYRSEEFARIGYFVRHYEDVEIDDEKRKARDAKALTEAADQNPEATPESEARAHLSSMEIEVPEQSGDLAKMGLQLIHIVHTDREDTLLIESVGLGGFCAAWNKEQAANGCGKQVAAGDRVVKVNGTHASAEELLALANKGQISVITVEKPRQVTELGHLRRLLSEPRITRFPIAWDRPTAAPSAGSDDARLAVPAVAARGEGGGEDAGVVTTAGANIAATPPSSSSSGPASLRAFLGASGFSRSLSDDTVLATASPPSSGSGGGAAEAEARAAAPLSRGASVEGGLSAGSDDVAPPPKKRIRGF